MIPRIALPYVPERAERAKAKKKQLRENEAGVTMSSESEAGENMSYTIEEIKEKALPIVKAHGVNKLFLFGSYAKGQATDDSDVDFYIDDGRVDSLLKYFAFVNDLEQSFGCHVDVVSMGIQDQNFLDEIKKEGIKIYENVG